MFLFPRIGHNTIRHGINSEIDLKVYLDNSRVERAGKRFR